MLRFKKLFKFLSVFLVVNLLYEAFFPVVAWALTGGPSQPEVESFEPVATTDMVDLFSGGFNYNIPLMDVGGYPINIAYHAGISMDQEASWVGLGWNINPGDISRTMRGLPDDFDGDPIRKDFHIKDNKTVGVTGAAGAKIFGIPGLASLGLGASLGVFNNNYKGVGVNFGISPSIGVASGDAGSLTLGLGLNFNSQDGLDISPSVSASANIASINYNTVSAGANIGLTYNSRAGLKGLSMSTDLSISHTDHLDVYDDEEGGDGEYLGTETASGGGTSVGLTNSFISFAAQTYTPTISMPMQNSSFTFHGTVGGEVFGVHGNVTITGYVSNQSLAQSSQTLPAFGYLYADQGAPYPIALMDFNREKDVPFRKGILNLPITNFTYDVFSASGQGTGGQYRAYRGDVGVLFDHQCSDISQGTSGGVELGFGDIFHGGADVEFTSTTTTTGQWLDANDFINVSKGDVHFQGNDGKSLYEPYYFKSVGTKTINDQQYYNSIGDTYPITVALSPLKGSTSTAENKFLVPLANGYTKIIPVNSNLLKSRREKRNQSFSFLTAQEAQYFALSKTIDSYAKNINTYIPSDSSFADTTIARTNYPPKHISEITILNPDGKRYIYGIPAYNTLQKEVTFSVNRADANPVTGIVKYNSGDNSLDNSEGRDNYYSSEQMPPYAHSYLLTAVLSPDYVDLTGNGISDDDLGEAVKINYTRILANYKWRVPTGLDTASYQESFMADPSQDKANYIYGTKQLWYVHSIESKTMVAQFYISSRNDGLGVVDENGAIDTSQRMEKLDSIKLFSKADLLQNGANAVPIKTVHFSYNYSLCHHIDNYSRASSDTSSADLVSGKLTLKSIWFTYGNNTKGRINSYSFDYCSGNYSDNVYYNPDYDSKHYDRWGNYKNNSYSVSGMHLPTNAEFPYTIQNKQLADSFSRAWDLTSITLPSGGQINIDYESNDYAYVQNQRAMQMCTLAGVGNSSTYTSNQLLYSSITHQNNFLFVNLPVPASSQTDLTNKYFSGITNLYFKCLVNIGNNSSTKEYVPGYTPIISYGLVNSNMAWVQLESATSSGIINFQANPIAMAAWQFGRLNLPQIAYPGSQNSGSAIGLIYALLGIVDDIKTIVEGYDANAVSNNAGQTIYPDSSYVRLDNPTYCKYGGGTRVKQLTISDNWSNMASGQNTFSYGQIYNYTTSSTDPSGNKITISSGVAAYEPQIGGDENPLRQPLPYEEANLLAPNNEFYTETPLGESLYPSPEVGYGTVTVMNLPHLNVSRTATGYVVNEFYTAHDYPVITSNTGLGEVPFNPSPLLEIFNIGVQDFMTASEGFAVEVNDMHGKPKGQEVYNQNNALISSVYYHYKCDNDSAVQKHLNNDVAVIDSSGTISTSSIGKDIDVWEDMRQQETRNSGTGVTGDLDFMLIGFPPFVIPLPIPTVFPSYSSSDTRFRSAVTTKYIYRSGILDRVDKMENGSSVSTYNQLFDAETGDVLLTKTTNEFNRPIYNFTYPAHWAYTGMGSAALNIGATVNNVTITTDSIKIANGLDPNLFFTPGDEVMYTAVPGFVTDGTKLWIAKPLNHLIVMDSKGNPVTRSSGTLAVIRSGHRNMAGTPIGTISSLSDPTASGINYVSQSQQIIQANATAFNDQWKTVCTQTASDCVDSNIAYKNGSYGWVYNLSVFDCFDFALDGLGGQSVSDILQGDFALNGPYVTLPFGQTFFDDGVPLDTEIYNPVDYDTLCCNQLPPYYKATFGDCYYTIQGIKTIDNKPIPIPWPFYTIPGTMKYNKSGLTCYLGQPLCDDDTSRNNLAFIMNNTAWWAPGIGFGGSDYYYPDTTCTHWDTLAIGTINCTKCTTVPGCQQFAAGDTINPYQNGMLGNWRPSASYVYYSERTPSLSASTTNIESNGTYSSFSPAWTKSGSTWNLNSSDPNWTMTNQITMYNPKGSEIENVDALGRYSAALYGYLDAFPTAVASNSKYKDLAFDNFEDYGFNDQSSSPCEYNHWNFIDTLVVHGDSMLIDTTSKTAHTGRYSLMLAPHDSASVTRSISYYSDSLFNSDTSRYYLKDGGCIYKFAPDSGNYILSAWVKENDTACNTSSYVNDRIKITFSGAPLSTYRFMPSGHIIDGWQRYYAEFHVPSTATNIKVTLISGPETTYFDDIRIHPFNSNMKSYVYDPTNLRLVAELDENNYATFYEYDDQGTLIRVKKETEEGIMTIKESRTMYHQH